MCIKNVCKKAARWSTCMVEQVLHVLLVRVVLLKACNT